MLSPFDPNNNPSSYIKLQKRVFQRVQAAEINAQIIKIVRESFEHAIAEENIELSPSEKARLQSQILVLVLKSMMETPGDNSISA